MGTRPTISLRKVKRNRKWISFVATGVLGISTVSAADAASVSWNLAGNGYWDVAGNWSSGSEPGINDDVTNSSNYQITLSDDSNPGTPVNYFANSLTNDGAGSFLINNACSLTVTTTLSNSTGSTVQTSGLNSTLNVDGTVTNNASTIYANTGSIINLDLGGATTLSNTNASQMYATGVDSGTNTPSVLNIGSAANVVGTVTNDNSTMEADTGAQMNVFADTLSNQNSASLYSFDGSTVTINAYTLNNTNGSTIFDNGSGGGGGYLTDNSFEIDNNAADIHAFNEGTVNLDTSSLLTNEQSAAMYAFNGSTLNLNTAPTLGNGNILNETNSSIYADGSQDVVNGNFLPQSTVNIGYSGDTASLTNDSSSIYAVNGGAVFVTMGSVTNQNGGNIYADGSNASNGNQSSVSINSTVLDNNNSTISSTNGSTVYLNGATSFTNEVSGSIYAYQDGTVSVDAGTLTNQTGAQIYADGSSDSTGATPSSFILGYSQNVATLTNDNAFIYAVNGGQGTSYVNTLTNQDGGDIYASGSNSTTGLISVVSLDAATLNNTGTSTNGNSTISANAGAQVNLLATTLNNNAGAQIYASDTGSVLNIGTGPVFSTAVNTFTNDNGLISADNSGTVNIGATNFSNQDGGNIFTGTGTPGGTINISTSSLDNTGVGSNIQAVDGGSLNITGGTITTEQQAALFVNGGSSATLLGSSVNVLSGGSDYVSGTGSTLQIGTASAPITTVSLDSSTVSNVTNYGTLTAFDGGQLNMYAGTLNIQDGAYLSAYQSSVSQPLPSVNLGDPSNPLGTVALTNAAGTGTSDLGVNQGSMNIWANTISVDGASQLYSQSTMNVGDATHMVNSLTVNGDGSTAFMDATGGSMNVYATSISNGNSAIMQAYGTGGVLNLLNSTGTVTNDGTHGFAYLDSTNGGSLTILAATLNNLGGGKIFNNDATSTLSLGSTSAPIGTINNIGVSPLTNVNYSQILADAGQTVQIYATNINQSSAGVMAAGQFGVLADAGTVLNIGDSNHFVTSLTNTGSGPLNVYGTTAIRAHYGATVNLYATTLDNSSYARIYSLQDGSALSGGTLNIHAVTLNNSTNGDVFSTGTGSTTTITATTVNNDATIEAKSGGLTTVNATTLSNTSNGILHAGGTSTVTINTPNTVQSSGSVVVDKGSSIGINNTLSITGGTSTVDGTLTTTGTMLSGGTLQGTGTLASSLMQTGGVFNPGQDPSSMSLLGNYSISNGIYQLDISSPTSFDMLSVSGSSNITGGTLSLDFLNGYTPTVGSNYNFLIAQLGYGSTDKFSSINSNLGNGWSFGYGSGTASVLGAPPAVPEASSVLGLLSMLGMSGIGIALRKRRS